MEEPIVEVVPKTEEQVPKTEELAPVVEAPAAKSKESPGKIEATTIPVSAKIIAAVSP